MFPAAFGDQVRQVTGDAAVGRTTTFEAPDPSISVNASAVLEPDCDGDGRGDETQDSSVDCAPPETQITTGPKEKTKRKKATFEFTAGEADATSAHRGRANRGRRPRA